MPRHVDQRQRRREIVDATRRVLAERGARGLTFRAVAEEMGGSSTLITHYFGSRQDLVNGLVEAFAEWPGQLASLEAGVDDPRERLRLFMRWLVPSNPRGLTEERARINMLGDPDAGINAERMFNDAETRMRELIAQHLEGLVAPEELPVTVDLIRSATNGVTLSTVEHPDEWSKERQFAVIDQLLALLGLSAQEE